jgi:transcriptional regulator with XRE-family HTH domain
MGRLDAGRALGASVRSLREGMGLSQEELADRAGLHRTYVGCIERGEKNPTILTVMRISSALGVRASDVVRDVEARLRRGDLE